MGRHLPLANRRLMRSLSASTSSQKIVITLDVRAAGSTNLHQGELSLVLRILLEETLDAKEALKNALGVIDPIDANGNVQRIGSDFLQQCCLMRMERLSLWLRRRIRERNTDREGTNQRDVVVTVDRKTLPLNARLQGRVHGLQKIVAMRLNMETDEIGPQQPFQQLVLPWTYPEGLRIRPWYMPEDSDASVRAPFFDQLRQKRKMVILNDDDRDAPSLPSRSNTASANIAFTSL